jgi:hypothetical protein
MPQDAPVKPISIVGLILVVLGIVLLVYFESPSSTLREEHPMKVRNTMEDSNGRRSAHFQTCHA